MMVMSRYERQPPRMPIAQEMARTNVSTRVYVQYTCCVTITQHGHEGRAHVCPGTKTPLTYAHDAA